MPGRAGIDTRTERDFFEYRPDIGFSPDKVVTPEIDPRLRQPENTRMLTIQEMKFLRKLNEADEKLSEIEQLIKDQQNLLKIPLDRDKWPDVVDAVDYFLSVDATIPLEEAIRATGKDSIITISVYNAAYDAVRKGGLYRSVGGDPHKGYEEAKEFHAQVQKWDSNRVLELAAYHIISIVLDFIGKKVIPGGPPPLGTLKKRFISWAKAILAKAVHSSPPEPSLGKSPTKEKDELPFDDDGAYGRIKSQTKPSIIDSDIPPIEAVSYGEKVIEFVHFKARKGDTPGANPGSFYMKPMYDYARDTHTATKVAVKLSSDGTHEMVNSFQDEDKFLFFTESDFLRYKGFIDSDKLNEYSVLVEDGPKRSISESFSFQALVNMGYDEFDNVLDHMIGTLRYWYRSPEAICCLVRALGLAGKVDKSILYGMRFLLIHLIQDSTYALDNVFDSLSQLLNSLVLGLIAKVFGILDSVSASVTNRLNAFVHSLASHPVARDCTPLDELLSVLSGAVQGITIELATSISGFIGDLLLRNSQLKKTVADVEKKSRFERLLAVLDAIINAVETGDLCADTPSVGEFIPTPTPGEIENFLTIATLPEFEDATRSKEYIIKKYGRDPFTGMTVKNAQTTSVQSDDIDRIVQELDKCHQRVTDEALENMIKTMRDRGVL